MRFCKILLLVILVSFSSFADLNPGNTWTSKTTNLDASGNPGVRKVLKILLVRASTYSYLDTWWTWWHNVTVRTTYPADLSSYDQVWDVRGISTALSATEQTALKNYMRDHQGSIFLMADNFEFSTKWKSIQTFVNAVTVEGNFAKSNMGYGNKSGYNYKLDTSACVSAENFNTDFKTSLSNSSGVAFLKSEYPGVVKLSELAGGYPILKAYGKASTANGVKVWSSSQWGASAIAYTPDKFKSQYAGSKLVIYLDEQTFRYSAKWQAYNSNELKNFLWNAMDFLTKTMPQATITATPSSADTATLPYEYSGSSLNVILKTESSNKISYKIFSKKDTTAWITSVGNIDTVTISGDATISASTVTDGTYIPATGSWEYKVKRTPPTITTTSAFNISLFSAVSGGEIVSDGGESIIEQGILWGTASGLDSSSNKILDTSLVNPYVLPISGLKSATTYFVKAYAINSVGIAYGDEITFATSTKPLATLNALPKDTIYTSQTLDVTLSTDSGNSIYFTIDGTTPDTTDSTQLLNGGSDSGVVTISGDVTINAIATGYGFSSQSKSFSYTQKLPSAKLTASPGDTTYPKSSLEVTLTSDTNNLIIYNIYSPDSTLISGPDTLITSGSLTITGDAILIATASGTGFQTVKESWSYESNLPSADLSAEAVIIGSMGTDSIINLSATDSLVHFGHEISLMLLSEGENKVDSIKWSFSSYLETVSSNSWIEYSGPITISDLIPYPDPHSDTIRVTAMAFDINHKSTILTYVFVSDTVNELDITKSAKFKDSLLVNITISKSWQNQKIYYTTDGTTPDSASMLYTAPFYIDSTATVFAIAYADNAVESDVKSSVFTNVAAVKSACYKDNNGDGAIDYVDIELTKSVVTPPDSITLFSPFDSTEFIIINKSDIIISDNNHLIANFSKPFIFSELKSTYFATDSLGAVSGAEYWDYNIAAELFEIKDSVAPVIIAARYIPTEVVAGKENEPLMDQLIITYSEVISTDSISKTAFGFYDQSENSEFLESLLISEELKRNGAIVNYSVVATNKYQPENVLDSIRIKSNGNISDVNGVVQKENTYWVPLAVSEYKYDWKVQIYPNPFSTSSPNKHAFDALGAVTKNYNDLIGIFITPIGPRALSGTITADIRIIDAVGNLLFKINDEELDRIDDGYMAGSYVYAIDPINKNGRIISSGVYVALIKIKHLGSDGSITNSIEKKLSIGVKK